MSTLPNTNSSTPSRRQRDSGHLLLAILLMMALMVIAATYEAPRRIQQLKRDREEEMIHRGTEYARAIKKYYKKFGSYPSTMEQLENTNNIRFLRKRYKDPLSKDGKWTLLHYNDVIGSLTNATGGPGIPAGGLASQGQQGLGTPAGQSSSPFGSSLGSSSPTSSGGFGTSSFGSSNTQPVNPNGIFAQQQSASGTGQQGTSGSTFGSSTTQTTTGDPSSSATGSSAFGNTPAAGTGPGGTANPNASTTLGSPQGLGGQTFGAGAIMGVASKSKDPTIRIYNKKKTYDEWQFIYNPAIDQANVLLKGPYSPSTLTTSNVGTPAGQLNQQNQQQSPFGQQNSPFGSQQPGVPNNPGGSLTPGGGQYPPDQSH